MRTTAATRGRILEAAGRLYREGGVSAVTTDTLARAVGTSKRTLYQHFTSRDDILETLFQARLDRLEAEMAAIEARPDPIVPKLRQFAELVAAVPADFPVGFWTELQRAAPAVAERVRARRDAIAHGALTRLFEAGVAAGEVRADVPVPLLVTVSEALAEGLLTREPPPGHSALAAAQAGFTVLLQGLLRR